MKKDVTTIELENAHDANGNIGLKRHYYKDNLIRIIHDKEQQYENWWFAVDIALALSIDNVRDLILRCTSHKQQRIACVQNSNAESTKYLLVNNAGLLALLLNHHTKESLYFRRWTEKKVLRLTNDEQPVAQKNNGFDKGGYRYPRSYRKGKNKPPQVEYRKHNKNFDRRKL